ncbi:hypothetical protein WN55_06709 [Dufourea novaeangliae]|uniref:Uncharacterized protein n=1 Tax=Dufourea novaeangliae TaxID=178035 RepID=A0A154PT06_DUFNO|nr:hypothetical protein WN55_06709 [Dufourea novaeangliae]
MTLDERARHHTPPVSTVLEEKEDSLSRTREPSRARYENEERACNVRDGSSRGFEMCHAD